MKILRITLEGKTYEVGVEVLDEAAPVVPSITREAPMAAPLPSPPAASSPATTTAEGFRVVTSPMAGQVFKCVVKPGDVLTRNQVVVVLDAMKMETQVVSPFAGTVRVVLVKEGDAVDESHVLIHIEESA